MSEKLKPCPICGVNNWQYQAYYSGTTVYQCGECGTIVDESAINTRPIEDELRKRIAELEGWGAPAVNKRYLVKLINDWITIATYYLRVGGGYWKDDRGQELADGVVSLWKGLEE